MNDDSIPTLGRPRPRRDRRRPAPPAARSGWRPACERLEDRRLPAVLPFSAAGAIALPVDPTVHVGGTIGQHAAQGLYRVELDAQGLLVADLHSPGVAPLLSLLDDHGKALIQGEATSRTDPDARIAQHLPAGTYYLSVSARSGSGSFSLSTTFTQSLTPGESITEGQGGFGVTTADVNGDGKPDIILPDFYYNQILINYGLGDGTFQAPVAIPVGGGPTSVVVGDFSGKGSVDLAVVDQLSDDVTILEGDGLGNFRTSQVLATHAGPVALALGDFSGDGKLDLAVADKVGDGVDIFRNQGNGTFVRDSWIGPIGGPTSLAAAG